MNTTTATILSWLGGIAIGAGLAIACKVPNPEHCVNQAEGGNDWCRSRYPARPYCSPCRRKFNGCVEFEPLNCEAYDPRTADTD